MRRGVVPFLVPRTELVAPDPWLVAVNHDWAELRDELNGWDYATELGFRREFKVDLQQIRSECKLDSSQGLAVTVHWHASGTGLRGCLGRYPLASDETVVSGRLGGNILGGRLRLVSRLVLLKQNLAAVPLAPSRPGSILWEDEFVTALEGEMPMFPIEVVDFAAVGLPENAAWHLDWGKDDLDASAMGAVRLYLNLEHEQIARLVRDGGKSEASALVATAVQWDLLRQMIERALDHPEFDNYPYETETVGSALANALKLVFPGDTVAGIRSQRLSARSDFESRIQAVGRLFDV